MSATLDLTLKTARRHLQANAEDVRDWQAIEVLREPTARGAAMARVVRDVIAHFDWMMDIDRMFRQSAGNARPNEEAGTRAQLLGAEFADYSNLVQATLRSVFSLPTSSQPPADQLAELQRHGAVAAELASVYEGEASFFLGVEGKPWAEVRRMLGV